LSLKTDNDYDETEKETVKWNVGKNVCCKTVSKEQEVRVGIKDWSVYYYLSRSKYLIRHSTSCLYKYL